MTATLHGHRAALYIAALMLAAGLAGCGGGGGSSDTSSASSAPPPSAGESAEAPHGQNAAVDVPLPALAPTELGGAQAAPASAVASAEAGTTSPAVAATAQDPQETAQAAGLRAGGIIVTPAVAGVDIYVSPSGNDAWSGTLAAPNANGTDGPLKTLLAAQALARSRVAAMVSSGTRQPLRVRLQPGTYALSAPLSFTAADSGTSSAPVSYEAVTPGTVTVTGAVTLAQLSAVNGSTPVLFENPAAGQNAWNGGGQLYVNGHRAVLARTPNVGQFAFVQKAIPLASEPAGAQGRTAFAATSDMLSLVAGLSASDRSRAVVNMMQAWTSGQHRLASSAPVGAIQLSPAANWTFLASGTSQRYWIENVSSALDAPGEFFWDGTGVRYIPLASEQTGSLTVQMPVLDKLISVAGDFSKNAWVDSLQFRGLKFAYTRALTPAGGYLDWQAASNVGAAIEVDGATNLLVDGCTFSGTGGYGVWLRRGVRTSTVSNSTFKDMGAGGIRLGQVSQQTTDVLQTGANSAINNVVGETGKVYPGAVGIWVGQSFDNTVSNNLVYNTTYTGISVGWTWGFGTATSGRNAVSNNLLVNIGLGQLSDMGGIYVVGVAPGTTVSGNVVREVRGYPAYGAGSWGIYGDSGTSQVTFTRNVVVGVDNGSLQLTTSRNNSVRLNLLGWGDITEHNVAQPDPQTALTVSNNVFLPKVTKPFVGYATSPYVTFSGNEVAETYAGHSVDLTMCGTGCTKSSSTVATTTDPRGVALTSTNTTLTSMVTSVTAAAGPTTLTNASSVVTVATSKPPVVVAPPITFSLDIPNAAIGSQPLGFWYSAPGNAAVLGVVAKSTAPSGKCLQYTDSASNTNGYDPHTYAPLNHNTGTTTGEFAVLIDANTDLVHQWRDNASPVKTGPALEVTANGVFVGGTKVANSTVGSWMSFKVTAPLAQTGTTWSLQVTDGNGVVTQKSGLPFATTGWGSLNWWGFISNARVSTQMCLASVKATNVQ